VTTPVTYQDHLAAITADPDDDSLRERFAAFLAPYDAPLARFIELQLERARRRRARRSSDGPGPEEEALLRAHGATWGHTLRKYTEHQVFYRGLIASITIEPNIFLEYGGWLVQNAPIRHVAFRKPDDGAFPLGELVESPLLERLDSIALRNLGLGDADVARLASSPHLTRLVALDLSGNPLGPAAFEALAASPRTRGLLYVARDENLREGYWPGERLKPTDEDDRAGAPVWAWSPPTPEGQALERAHGYLPWLHPSVNGADELDLRWYLDHGVLPVTGSGAR